MSIQQNLLKFTRGDTEVAELTLDDDAVFVPGDILFFTVKRKIIDADADALIALDSSGAQIEFTPGESTARVTVLPADTIDYRRTVQGVYDWQLDRNGQIVTLERGVCWIVQDVTRRVATA